MPLHHTQRRINPKPTPTLSNTILGVTLCPTEKIHTFLAHHHKMTDNANRYIAPPMLDVIEAELRQLEQEFQVNQALLLTEDDLQCHLFGRLRARYPTYIETMDRGVTGLAIHSEVKFYDEDGKLTLIPDLCIIPPGELSIYASIMYGSSPRNLLKRNRLPSKNFEFGGDALAIELKFCRKKGGINAKDINHYKKDVEKLKRLRDLRHNRSEGREHLLGLIAILNKTEAGGDLVQELIEHHQENDIRIFYGTGKVDFRNFDGAQSLLNPRRYVGPPQPPPDDSQG